MQKLKLFIVAAICCLSIITVSAIPDSHQSSSNSSSTVLHQKGPASQRPNAPSRVYIECRYGAGVMEFSFIEGVNSMSVTVANESYQSFDIVTAEEPMMELSLPSGEYAIECLTDDGRTFTGTIVL